MKDLYIGLDIGGTKCAVSLGAVEGSHVDIFAKKQFPTTPKDPDAVCRALLHTAEKMLMAESLSFSDIKAIGISCGGPLDSRKGLILGPPNLPGWDEVHIKEFFEDNTGVQTYIQNDANACAVAEWKFGAGKGCENMIFLTFGTGLGAGLILDGKLYSGTNDMAGEIGHVRLAKNGPIGYGKSGSAEGFCSGGGLAQLGVIAVRKACAKGESPLLLETAGSEDKITAKLIAELADKGDPMCINIYKECGRKLGRTLSILIDILNPERIVLGGIYMRAAHLIIPTMERTIKREALSYAADVCSIHPAGLGENVGDYAAIAVACC